MKKISWRTLSLSENMPTKICMSVIFIWEILRIVLENDSTSQSSLVETKIMFFTRAFFYRLYAICGV